MRRTEALRPAGQLFSTGHGTKEPRKRYSREEWTPEMVHYGKFVEEVSPHLVGHKVALSFIKDRRMVCGQFFGSYSMVDLAHRDVKNWQAKLELMLRELAHTVVQSNGHLSHKFLRDGGHARR